MLSVYKILGAVAFIVAVFFYGRSVGVDVVTLEHLEVEAAAQRDIDVLTVQLRKADELLIIEQQRETIIQREEVVKYVTKYRDKIKMVPTYIECIDNSGVLELINATTPTVASIDTTRFTVDRTSIAAALYDSGNR